MKGAGFDDSKDSVEIYREFCVKMTKEERSEFFFMKANDLYFKPSQYPVR